MDLAIAATGSVNRAWAFCMGLAILTLVIIWFTVPRTNELVVGKDGRWSTSKFQGTAWTLVVLFALFSLLWAFTFVQVGDLLDVRWITDLRDPLATGFDDFFSNKFDATYLVLLGIPLGAVVTSKAITTNKVANGAEVKPPKSDSNSTTALQELVGNDNGETEISDFQFLLFNLLAIAYFLVAFMSNPVEGLPSMPDTLIGLTGVSAAAYISKKALYKEPPILLGVLPPSAKAGDPIEVYGQHLLTTPDAGRFANADAVAVPDSAGIGTMVVIGGQAAELVGAPTDTKVVAKVPPLPAGGTKLQVMRPPGARSEELPFTVLES